MVEAASPVDRPAAADRAAAGVLSRVDRPAAVGPVAAEAAFPEARPVAEVPVAAAVACRVSAACRFPDPTSATPSLCSTAGRTHPWWMGSASSGDQLGTGERRPSRPAVGSLTAHTGRSGRSVRRKRRPQPARAGWR